MIQTFKIENMGSCEHNFLAILGPCVIEGEKITRKIADEIKKITTDIKIPFIFKASFDKANRSSLHSYRGPGIEKGLKILQQIKTDLQVPIMSDIHESWQAEQAAEVLSILQIPAFLCRQTDLLIAAGKTGKPVNVKKGQFMAPEDMFLVTEKIASTGNDKILITERGNFFGYRNLVVDFRNIAILKKSGYPVIIDATHAVQRPTQDDGVTGGNPEFIPTMAACGIVAGSDGVFLETHPQPAKALSDGRNSLNIKNLKTLLIQLKKLYNVYHECD